MTNMEAEIIAVGTELLLGDILNTNAQFLSRELAALGITVHFQTVVGDNPARLESVVRQARGRSDLLVFSGGLGPTEDDLTKQTVARAFGDTLRFDEAELEKIRAFFTAWGRTMPENNKKQAMVPTHGRKIPNANGTAPGMIFEDQAAPGKYAVLLPGPPKELQPMFLNSVKPWLAAMSDSVLHSVTLRVTGVGESHLESRIDHLLENANPTAAVYAKTAEVVIRITAKAASEDEARRVCLDYAKHFYDILGDCVYAMDADSLEEVVVKELAARGLTVATAESCTGGMLSQRITAVPGASGVFAYGACTYANDIKEKMLGVRHETLEAYGAVSPETAAEMARGVRKAAGADFGVGITGIAGHAGKARGTCVSGRLQCRYRLCTEARYHGPHARGGASVQHAARAGDGAPPGAGPAAAGLHGLPGGGAGPSDAERHACAGRIAPACSIPEPPEPA